MEDGRYGEVWTTACAVCKHWVTDVIVQQSSHHAIRGDCAARAPPAKREDVGLLSACAEQLHTKSQA